MWLDTKDLSDQTKVEKMKDDIYSKILIITKLDGYVTELIENNNLLIDKYDSLKERISFLEGRSNTAAPIIHQPIKKPDMSDAINSL